MKWWVFNQEQLEKALETWRPAWALPGAKMEEFGKEVTEFLLSPSAQVLRGDDEQ